MDLSIVIVNWNTRDLLLECLDSIFRTITKPSFDVWVVDNASVDGSMEAVAGAYPQVQVIQNERNEGFGKPNNQGIAASTGACVLLLNTDIVLTEGAVDTVWQRLNAQDKVGVLGCRLVGPDGEAQVNVHMRFPHGPSLKPGPPLADGLEEASWLWAAFLMAKRKVFEQVGLFDQDFLLFYEDTDLCWRARDAGWIIAYCPDVSVIHGSRQSANKLPGEVFSRWLLIAEHLLYKKHHSAAQYCFYAWRRRTYYGFRVFVHTVLYRLTHTEWNKTRMNWFSQLHAACQRLACLREEPLDIDRLWGRFEAQEQTRDQN
jgi:GT2 family glycosyltransferase